MPKLTIGTNLCRCGACGEYFSTPSNFDRHRKWQEGVSRNARTRVCVYPGELVNKKGKARLRRNLKGFWVSAEPAYLDY